MLLGADLGWGPGPPGGRRSLSRVCGLEKGRSRSCTLRPEGVPLPRSHVQGRPWAAPRTALLWDVAFACSWTFTPVVFLLLCPPP